GVRGRFPAGPGGDQRPPGALPYPSLRPGPAERRAVPVNFDMRPAGSNRSPAEGPAPEAAGEPPERVNLAAERRDAQMDQVLDALDTELVGLAPVKTRIREIAALLLIERLRER